MTKHNDEKDAHCWRSECRNGCYYPDMCSERPSAEKERLPMTDPDVGAS